MVAKQSQQQRSKILPTEIGSTSPIELHYYETKDLTLQPRLIGGVAFDSPEQASIHNSGTVQLRLLLSEKGVVEHVISNRSSLPETFVKSVKRAFLIALFKPGEIDNQAVPSQLFVEIRYETNVLSDRN